MSEMGGRVADGAGRFQIARFPSGERGGGETAGVSANKSYLSRPTTGVVTDSRNSVPPLVQEVWSLRDRDVGKKHPCAGPVPITWPQKCRT